MLNLDYTDPNSVRKRFKNLKYYIKSQEIIRERIGKIQNKLDNINWTEKTRTERTRLYQELGRIIEIYRNNKIRIN